MESIKSLTFRRNLILLGTKSILECLQRNIDNKEVTYTTTSSQCGSQFGRVLGDQDVGNLTYTGIPTYREPDCKRSTKKRDFTAYQIPFLCPPTKCPLRSILEVDVRREQFTRKQTCPIVMNDSPTMTYTCLHHVLTSENALQNQHLW